MLTGKLKLRMTSKGLRAEVEFENAKGKLICLSVDSKMAVNESLRLAIQSLSEAIKDLPVTLEFSGNKVSQIEFSPQVDVQTRAALVTALLADTPRFHNPYNFVPALPRDTLPVPNELADRCPVGHDLYLPKLYSGTLQVVISMVTPLLIADPVNATAMDVGKGKQHHTYPVRVDAHGSPVLAATAIKGALRSAFEAITNSRFGVWDSGKHRNAIGYGRKEARNWDPATPSELIHASLLPATDVSELSPADRVFGWVAGAAGNPPRAYRGQLRIGPVHCESSNAVVEFPDPVPLAILAQPKTAQGRFYVAVNSTGFAQPDDLVRTAAGYEPGKGLRGRKVFPHHQGLSENYWLDPTSAGKRDAYDGALALPNGTYREYLRPFSDGGVKRDAQNRSVRGWVREGTCFRFSLQVINLSGPELGALAYLFTRDEGFCLRLGGGKPLGFGSATARLAAFEVRRGDAVAESYRRAFAAPEPLDDGATAILEGGDAAIEQAGCQSTAVQDERPLALPGDFVGCYQREVEAAYGSPFAEVAFIAAYERAARGFDDGAPVHYPRESRKPDPTGRNYTWFQTNDSGGKYALPDLAYDPGLPIDPISK